MPKVNEIGNKYGKLIVISESQERIRGRVCWNCQCDCGNTITVTGTDLRTGRKTDCGCVPNYNFKDETNNRYGRLTVLKQSDKKTKSRAIFWQCQCDCGNIIEVAGTDLRQGKIKSCGCLNQELRGQSSIIDEMGNRYGKLLVVGKIRPDNRTTYWKCQCDCGNITYYKGEVLRQGRALSCGCLHSVGNQKIKKYFLEKNINYEAEIAFPNLVSSKGGHPRFDFGIYNKQKQLLCLIEYQGEQHFINKGEFGKVQREETDLLKKLYCQDEKIPLYEIKYDDDIEVALSNILKDFEDIE